MTMCTIPYLRRGPLALALVVSSAPLAAQSTAAQDSAHWRAAKVYLDSIARDRSAPQYSKRNQARLRALDSAHAVKPAPIPPVDSSTIPATVAITSSSATVTAGQNLQLYPEVRNATGAIITAPVAWSVSSPLRATISGTGVLTGVSAGTVTVYARATPTLTGARDYPVNAIVPIPPPVDTTTPPPVIGFDGIAELPRLTAIRAAPGCTVTVRVTAGMDLQQQLNMIQPGGCLLLAAGATFTGNFVLPAKGSTSWITIATEAALPTAGTRMTPSLASSLSLAKLLSPNYSAALTVAQGASYYRLRGLEVSATAAAQATGMNMLIDVRNTSRTFSVSTAPRYLQLEQLYIHGTPTLDLRRCIWYDPYLSSVVDSWLSDCHSNNTDSQAGLQGSGAKGNLWENNHLEGGHEPFMSGGFDPPDSTMQPSDITFRRNHVIRPIAWKGVWQAKNMIETKNVRRMLIEGNVIENSWPDAQAGFCFVMKGENQDNTAPWSTTADVVIRYNIIRNCASVFNVSGRGTAGPVTNPSSRFVIKHNYAEGIAKLGGDGIPIQSLHDVTDQRYLQNTFLNGLQGSYSNQAISMDGTPGVRLQWDGNVLGHGQYGVKGSNQGDGSTTLNFYAPGGVFTRNAIVGGGACTQYPAGNTCPSIAPPSTSTVGADMAKVNAMTAGVVVPDLLALRRSIPQRRQLKYGIPATSAECQKPNPARVCAEPPMRLR